MKVLRSWRNSAIVPSFYDSFVATASTTCLKCKRFNLGLNDRDLTRDSAAFLSHPEVALLNSAGKVWNLSEGLGSLVLQVLKLQLMKVRWEALCLDRHGGLANRYSVAHLCQSLAPQSHWQARTLVWDALSACTQEIWVSIKTCCRRGPQKDTA